MTVSSDLDRKRRETEDLLRTVGIDYSTSGMHHQYSLIAFGVRQLLCFKTFGK